MTKRELKNVVSIAVLLAAVLAYFGMRCLPHQKISSSLNNGLVFVSRAIDGDTIKLSDGGYVRFIGIDTPESRYNKKIVRDSKRSGSDIKSIILYNKKIVRDSKRSGSDIKSIIRMGIEASDFTRRKVQ